VSPVVHALPSSQAVVVLLYVQPEPAAHTSVVQVLPSSQLVGTPAQLPFWHASPSVHALPSLHALVVFLCKQPTAG
jgi:hypothetical protein